MTKPSNFILNTDYLALSQTNTGGPFTLTFPQAAYPVVSGYASELTRTRDFTYKSTAGALDEFQIEYGGKTYACHYLQQEPNEEARTIGGIFVLYRSESWYFWLHRKDANTITATLTNMPNNLATTSYAIPAMTFKVSVVSFRPPNLF